jgi:hypothetical protein
VSDRVARAKAMAKMPQFSRWELHSSRVRRLACATAIGALALVAGIASVHAALAAEPPRTKTCPVTLPNKRQPLKSVRAALPPIPPVFHGNAKLWVKLWPLGVIVAKPNVIDSNGSIAIKLPWWRGRAGHLTITATRLDARVAPIRGDVPRGYGLTGFQASAVAFPTQGCWKVIGRVGSTRLVFVTLVVNATGNGY